MTHTQDDHETYLQQLPPLVAGPVLRRVDATQVAVWCVTTTPVVPSLALFSQGQPVHVVVHCETIPVGERAYIQWLRAEVSLTEGEDYHYDLLVDDESVMPDGLSYDDGALPRFVWQKTVGEVLHGSCRKPHFAAKDGFCAADARLANDHSRPSLLILSGDQVYLDDVAGPMVLAIREVITRLGLYQETFEDSAVADSHALWQSPLSLYRRTELLPDIEENERLQDKLFGGVKKPIFTSASADNHLISLSEMLAMYFLTWSPALWQSMNFSAMTRGLDQAPYADLSDDKKDLFYRELKAIEGFVADLPKAARVLANLPSYMMFDDHDITDDWNLTRGWEEVAYGHPFSKRIIGNGLLAYLLCQGWGNQPESSEKAFYPALAKLFAPESFTAEQNISFLSPKLHDTMVEDVLHYGDWHYTLDTSPAVVVLDTRTHRWRSESRAHKPSGLMDWESLVDMQHQVIDKEAVIIVSPAPIFGVKLIEVVQKIFTFFGKALLVDAENWMAHRGAANVLLNIFKHSKTPQRFTILSGDVHYSFVYDVKIRFRNGGPQLWQITHSGIKNQFPEPLLTLFDSLNRWLYGRYSPLNIFTKRRSMELKSRSVVGYDGKLLNHTGMGYVHFDDEGAPHQIGLLVTPESGGNEHKEIQFEETEDLQI
ncbi:MAG: alkaline phosphatase family protein [Pontibacterium sp.]